MRARVRIVSIVLVRRLQSGFFSIFHFYRQWRERTLERQIEHFVVTGLRTLFGTEGEFTTEWVAGHQ